jgi:RNA recognition motif-containing protein
MVRALPRPGWAKTIDLPFPTRPGFCTPIEYTMATKLFVGNLPFRASEDELRDHFEQCGEVTYCKICYDRETGNSRGFGFVEFADVASADRGRHLDGHSFQGRVLRVNDANAKPSHAR